MEDRYLFKAKGQTSNRWYYGMLTFCGECTCHIKDALYNEKICDTSTLCQCTGLKDENGKLIWENDIVKTKVGTAKVVWDKSEWRIEWLKNDLWRKDLYYWAVKDIQRLEIIGNIFDNKELLESKE